MSVRVINGANEGFYPLLARQLERCAKRCETYSASRRDCLPCEMETTARTPQFSKMATT